MMIIMNERRVLGPWGGKFLIALGLLMVFMAVNDWLKLRARYVSSQPGPGTTVAAPPATVIIRFSEGLDSSSTITVRSTVTLTPSGDETPSGRDVTTRSGVDVTDPQERSLRAELQTGLPRGLYRVEWHAVAARGKAWRYGVFYFGIGMPAPAHVFGFRGGPLYERDGGLGVRVRGGRHTRVQLLLSGIFLISLGLLLPRRRPGR
jgi:methionine-rich copper-binding protein CopC